MAKTDILGVARKFVSFISVEPFTLCWLLPSCLLLVAMENLNLEKSCRVNLGQSDEICRNMIDKTINDITCVDEFDSNRTDDPIYNLSQKVCAIETESQKLLTIVYGSRAPIASIFPFIIVVFAGGWSDKKGIRKPLVLLPIVGELIGCLVLLLSAIFMHEIPMEVPAYTERVVPSIFGGSALMLMGVYSYLSQITAEEDRTFRFGCLTVFLTLIPVLSIPLSGILFNALGYIKLFTLCVIIYILGILHILFILKEVSNTTKTASNEQSNGVENPNFVNDNNNASSEATEGASTAKNTINEIGHDDAETPKKGFLREFFDPTLVKQLIVVVWKKRDGNMRTLIWLVILCNIAFLASLGENDLTYFYARLKLNWSGVQYSLHLTYATLVALLGTLLMVGVFSKIFGVSDAMIGILSTILTLIAKPIYAFATTTAMFYAGTTIDLFLSTKAIAIKAIISKVIQTDELGKMFSVLAIIESVVQFIFPPLYAFVYHHTVETFIGAIFFVSEFFFVLTLMMFIIIYMMVPKTSQKEDDVECTERYKSNPELYESTKL